jgi:hypothetical protein
LIVMEFWPWGMQRMGVDANLVIEFAASSFPHGLVMRHENKPELLKPMMDVVAELRALVAEAGEYNVADLVLMPPADP